MLRTARGAAAALVILLMAAGCDSPPASSLPVPARGGLVEQLRYTCGTFPFDLAVLDRPGTAEQQPGPPFDALRRHLLTPGPDFDFLPDSGWILVGQDGTRAEFVARRADGGLASVSIGARGDGWAVRGWGECRPQLMLPAGLGVATWELPSGEPPPGPATQVFGVLVTERECASGRPPGDRLVGPQVVFVDRSVLVVFAVRAQEGMHTCPSNPAVRVRVDLGAPLGDRELVDPSLMGSDG